MLLFHISPPHEYNIYIPTPKKKKITKTVTTSVISYLRINIVGVCGNECSRGRSDRISLCMRVHGLEKPQLNNTNSVYILFD